MKKLYVILILTLMLFIPTVFAEDQVVTFTPEQQNILDDNGNLIGVELTYTLKGGDTVAIQHDIEYEADKMKLKEITANGSFTETHSDIYEKGKKGKTSIVVDGEYAYSEAPYLKLYFEFTDKFLPYTSSVIRMSNNKACGLVEKLIDLYDKEITLTINGNNMLSVNAVDINRKLTFREWVEKNKTYLYIAGIVILALIVLDILYVSFRNRKQTVPFNTNATFKDNTAKHLRNVFTDTQENENKANGIDPDKYKYKCIILFLIGISVLSIGVVHAVQGSKNQDIRDYIVGKTEGKSLEDLDISGDKVVDVVDLVIEKNTANYEIIRIKEFNTEFLRNMNLYYIDLFQSKIPFDVYSVEYNKSRHFTLNTIYDINAFECDLGTIENFNKVDNPNNWTYEFDYTLTEGKDNCYMQAVAK